MKIKAPRFKEYKIKINNIETTVFAAIVDKNLYQCLLTADGKDFINGFKAFGF